LVCFAHFSLSLSISFDFVLLLTEMAAPEKINVVQVLAGKKESRPPLLLLRPFKGSLEIGFLWLA
ncbi:hypothetical protein YC68_24450, partial [Vibrio parahaemolyticus]